MYTDPNRPRRRKPPIYADYFSFPREGPDEMIFTDAYMYKAD